MVLFLVAQQSQCQSQQRPGSLGEGLALLVPITETKASGKKNTNKDSRSTPSGAILAPTAFACLVVCQWMMRPVDNTVDMRVHVCLFAFMLTAQKHGTTGGKEAHGVQGRGARRAGLFLEWSMCTKVGGSTLEAPRSCPHAHGRKRSPLPHQHLSKLLPLLFGSGKVEGKTAGREGGRGQRSTTPQLGESLEQRILRQQLLGTPE